LHEQHSHGLESHATQHDHSEATTADSQDAVVPPIPFDNDHACRNCCSVCTVPALMPVDLRFAVTFDTSSIGFSPQSAFLFDRPILVDPGIPKRIA
jgi:hypothetical protein